MIKVLQVGFSDNYGGIESCIMNYYRNIDREQIQFGFTDIRDRDIAYHREILELGGWIHKMKPWSKRPLEGMKNLYRLINEQSYDIVHFNMYSMANILPFLAADRSKAKAWILHGHTTAGELSPAKRILQKINRRFLVGRADELWACSEAAVFHMFAGRGRGGQAGRTGKEGHTRQARIIRNAVDTAKFRFDSEVRERIRRKYHLEDAFVIGNVGRFMYPKNHHRLIEMFVEVRNREPKARLILIGDGELRKEIEDKAEQFGVKDEIIFTGMIENTCEYYSAFDMYLLPSFFEGLPVSGMEAQAAGLPMVVSDGVSRELQITDQVKFLSLEEDNRVWADEILKTAGRSRGAVSGFFEASGYDIRREAVRLQELYASLAEEGGKWKVEYQ